MSYTLRYLKGAPIQPRPHAPCVPFFSSYSDADDYLEKQPNKAVLEVVQR